MTRRVELVDLACNYGQIDLATDGWMGHLVAVKALKPEEEWSRRVLAHQLGVPVEQHDDGSLGSMYDLRVVYQDRPAAAVEITGDVDGQSVELWKLLNGRGKRWIEEDLVGGWTVTVRTNARAKLLRQQLPAVLRSLEAAGETSLEVNRWTPMQGPTLVADRLGVVSLHQAGTDFPGSIYVLFDEMRGGFVANTGNGLTSWITEFLAGDGRRDLRRKLASSGAAERHAFLLVASFTNAGFEVEDLLMRNDPPLPEEPLALPAEVTHVWTMSTWASGRGLRWSPSDGWGYFDKLLDSA